MAAAHAALTDDDRVLIRRALRRPRGHYPAERAGQLSGIPARTLYDWASHDVMVPDWADASPRAWSYRDLIYARLLAWLRSKGVDRVRAARRVADVRRRVVEDHVDPALHGDGRVVLFGFEDVDRLTGQQVFDGLTPFLDVFDIAEPIEGVATAALWGPNLVRPSSRTFISPWVVGGEPCIDSSRVPTASVYALHKERSLGADRIAALYPGVSVASVKDAIKLEESLRKARSERRASAA